MNRLVAENFLCVLVIALALAVGAWPQNVGAQTSPAAAADTSVAPVTPVAPPPNIVPGSPYAEVVRLTQAGVDQSIITTYVQNSTSLFNLDSDKIIYLTNLGAPNTLVTAMMQRDQQLQQQFAATQAAEQAQQATPPETTPVTPAPETTPSNTTDVTPAPEPAPVTVDYFYTSLAPYGTWVVVNGYGRCWRPTVCVYNSNWQPYCDNGHWVYTDCGWYWASTYAWGATFHYGRWFRDASFGWCWYPDTVWAPSWVTWRYSNNYCGWAPLPPHTTYRTGVGIVYNGGNVSVGFSFGLGANCFTFVPTQYFCSSHPRNYCVAPAQVTQVYNNTTIINNYSLNNRTIVNHGIAVENIAAASHAPIRPVPVHQVNNLIIQRTQNPRIYHSGAVSGTAHQGYTRDFGSPLRTSNSPQMQHYNAAPTSRYSASPANNNYARPQENPNQTPAVNQAGSNPESAPRQWQPTGTPRSMTAQNYHYYSAPQSSAPVHASAPSHSQGGSHYGNGGSQNWHGH